MLTAKRYDAASWRLYRGQKIVGFALALAGGRWCLATRDGVRIGRRYWYSPEAVAKAAPALLGLPHTGAQEG